MQFYNSKYTSEAGGSNARSERIAKTSLIAVLSVAVIAPAFAAASGIIVEVAFVSVFAWLTLVVLLASAFYHYRTRDELKLAMPVGGLLGITLAGSAGGVISITGQTFSRPLIDPWLAGFDQAMGLCAISATKAIGEINSMPELLGAAYVSSIPLILISVLALGFSGRAERMWELCASFAVCILISTISSAIFPAVGAFHFLKIPVDVQAALPAGSGVYHLPVMMDLRQSGIVQLDAAHLQGLVTFPSFHTAMALMTAAAWRDHRELRWPVLAWNILVIASTIPIGGHYFIDLAAGGLVWLCWTLLSASLFGQQNLSTTAQRNQATA